MRLTEVQAVLSKHPFEPFQIQLSNGQTYAVRHPEFAGLTRSSLFVGVPSEDDAIPDRMVQCDLLHIVAIEPVDGSHG